MNVSCGSCPAKYAIPDDKVRGRKVRITCKRCGAPIVVDGTSLVDAAASLPGSHPDPAGGQALGSSPVASAVASRRRGMKQTMIGIAPISPGAAPAPASKPDAARSEPRANVDPPTPAASALHASKRTIVGGIEAPRPNSGPIPTPMVQAPAPSAASAASSAPEWTVAITDDQHEEMSTGEVVELYAAGTIGEDTFIWKEGMEDWKTPLEIPAIAERIEARGLRVRSAPRALASQPRNQVDPYSGRAPIEKQGPGTPMGVWREPGSSGWGEIPGWSDPDGAGSGDVSFDDVTVAMAAPQAEELLRAASGEAQHGARLNSPEERGPFSAESAPLSNPMAAELTVTRRPSAPDVEVGSAPGSATPAMQASAPITEEPALPGDADHFAEQRALRRESAADRDNDLFADLERVGSEAETETRRESHPESDIESEDSSGSPSAPRLAGARNESSVLFSLDALIKNDDPDAEKPLDHSEEDLLGLSGHREAEADASELQAPLAEGSARAASSPLLEPAQDAPAESAAPSVDRGLPATAPEPNQARSTRPEQPSAKRGLMWVLVLLLLALLGAAGALLLSGPGGVFSAGSAPSAEPTTPEAVDTTPPPPAVEEAPVAASATAEPTGAVAATDAEAAGAIAEAGTAAAVAADAGAAALPPGDAALQLKTAPKVAAPRVRPAPKPASAPAAPPIVAPYVPADKPAEPQAPAEGTGE